MPARTAAAGPPACIVLPVELVKFWGHTRSVLCSAAESVAFTECGHRPTYGPPLDRGSRRHAVS